MKVRRIGSFTCGAILVTAGIAFLLHQFIPSITYEAIFSFWPVILILLGVEILVSNALCRYNNKTTEKCVEFKYDFAAVVLIFILTLFSMGMGIVDRCIEYEEYYLENYHQ